MIHISALAPFYPQNNILLYILAQILSCFILFNKINYFSLLKKLKIVFFSNSHMKFLFFISDQSGNNIRGMRSGGMSDMSNDSESPTHGYPDFPPSPDSWLGESVSRSNQAINSNQTSDC